MADVTNGSDPYNSGGIGSKNSSEDNTASLLGAAGMKEKKNKKKPHEIKLNKVKLMKPNDVFKKAQDDMKKFKQKATHDLSHLGAKKDKSPPTKAVFGVALTEDGDVPPFITIAILFLEQHIAVEGLFRVSGDFNEMNRLKSNINNGESINFESSSSPHVVAGLLKMYFRELPEPLLTFELYDMFIAADAINDSKARLECIRKVINFLPRCNAKILRILCQFLSRVASNADKNKMRPSNLAIIFAPNLLRPINDTPEVVIGDSPHANGLVTTLIDHCDHFFAADEPEHGREDKEQVIETLKRLSSYKLNSLADIRKAIAEYDEEKRKQEEEAQLNNRPPILSPNPEAAATTTTPSPPSVPSSPSPSCSTSPPRQPPPIPPRKMSRPLPPAPTNASTFPPPSPPTGPAPHFTSSPPPPPQPSLRPMHTDNRPTIPTVPIPHSASAVQNVAPSPMTAPSLSSSPPTASLPNAPRKKLPPLPLVTQRPREQPSGGLCGDTSSEESLLSTRAISIVSKLESVLDSLVRTMEFERAVVIRDIIKEIKQAQELPNSEQQQRKLSELLQRADIAMSTNPCN